MSDPGGTAIGVPIGVLGADWRAIVTPWGDVVPADGSPTLSWAVAADDRWHRPAEETTVRQRRLHGTPVVETRVRVPGGDAVQRVWATADGVTLVEVENASSMPIAVAFTRSDLLTSRPPADVPIEGIDLPEGTIVLPVGHTSSVRVGIAHDGSGAGRLPADLPGSVQVARGWTTVTDRAGRLVLPEWADDVVAERCTIALEGPPDPADDPVGFLIAVGELVRTADAADPWVIDVVGEAEPLMRRHRAAMPWDVAAALWSTARVLSAAGETRGASDVVNALLASPMSNDIPPAPPTGVRLVPWVEGRLVRTVAASACALMPHGWPEGWLGAPVEAYRVPVGIAHHVSFAVRWHGERPAVLWEVEGPAGLEISGGGVDAAWTTVEATGEALWAAPALG
jgi:hypothetical protein